MLVLVLVLVLLVVLVLVPLLLLWWCFFFFLLIALLQDGSCPFGDRFCAAAVENSGTLCQLGSNP